MKLDNESKKLILYGIGAVLFISFILAIANILVFSIYSSIFWLCYIGLFLIVVGIYKNKSWLVLTQIIILAVPDLLWIIDFFAIAFTGTTIFSLSTYFFDDFPLLSRLVSLQHLYTIPLSLSALYLMKLDKKSKNASHILGFSFVQVILSFAITRIFVSYADNINCVYYPCFDIFITNFLASTLPYFIGWLIVMSLIILISYYIILRVNWFRRTS